MEATQLLMNDHREVEALFAEFLKSDSQEIKRGFAEAIIRDLSRHSAIEEAKLYPVIRDELPNGKELYREAIEEHQGVKEVLADLDGMLDEVNTTAFRDKIEKLQREVEHHVEEEETEVFPELRTTLTKTRLDEIGAELEEAKASAPTRPHPNQPPATDLTGKALGAVDKLRDTVSGRSE